MSPRTTPAPLVQLLEARNARGWSRHRAALAMQAAARAEGVMLPEVESVEKALSRHEKGQTRPDATYVRLYCRMYGLTPQQLVGALDVEASPCGTFAATSHKFVMAYVGCDGFERLAADPRARPAEGQWFDCHVLRIPSPFGEVDLYVWPFGALACHVVESARWVSIADLAGWRVSTYPENMQWLRDHLKELLPQPADVPYTFSVYWVDEPAWTGEALETAAHLLSAPKTLLGREESDPQAQVTQGRLIEKSLIAERFTHSDVTPFGVPGISVAAASWSSVAYCPLASERALQPSELVACQLALQALWVYCDHIAQRGEQGEAADIGSAYRAPFLRRARSRVNMARPQETGQHRAMRAAAIETSGLDHHLLNAMELLQEMT